MCARVRVLEGTGEVNRQTGTSLCNCLLLGTPGTLPPIAYGYQSIHSILIHVFACIFSFLYRLVSCGEELCLSNLNLSPLSQRIAKDVE